MLFSLAISLFNERIPRFGVKFAPYFLNFQVLTLVLFASRNVYYIFGSLMSEYCTITVN